MMMIKAHHRQAALYQWQNKNRTRTVVFGGENLSLPIWWERNKRVIGWQKVKKKKGVHVVVNNIAGNKVEEANPESAESSDKSSWKVKAIVKVKLTRSGFFSSLTLNKTIDDITDLLGKSLLLELLSSHLHPGTYLLNYLSLTLLYILFIHYNCISFSCSIPLLVLYLYMHFI